jgi:predicted phosphodiesterase
MLCKGGFKVKVYKSILVLPDMHLPWVHEGALDRAARWAKKHKPDIVVQLGDLIDAKGWSRWPTDSADLSPDEEWEAVEKAIHKLHKSFPKMEILSGNHDRRHLIKASEGKIPSKLTKTLNEVFPFKGWNWHVDPRKKLVLNTVNGKILFCHGDEDGGKPIDKASFFGMSVVQGHDHKAAIEYRQVSDKFLFGVSAGNLMDPESKAADYNARSSKGSVQGFLVIKNGNPMFITGRDGGGV